MNEKPKLNLLPEHTEDLARAIVDSAMQIHTALGPGLLESVYEACLAHELKIRGINVQSQVMLPVVYKGIKIDSGFRLDLLVDKVVVVEIKSADMISEVFKAQLLTYLRLANVRLGLLINFNVVHLRDGIKRIIN